MPREMPILKHKGDKLLAGKSFWSIPQDITIYAFKHLTYSETQLLIYLMGNRPMDLEQEYEGWQLSNLNECMSGNDSTVRAARRTLSEMGFIQQVPGTVDSTYSTLVVDFDWIREVVENDWSKEVTKSQFQKRSGAVAPQFANK